MTKLEWMEAHPDEMAEDCSCYADSSETRFIIGWHGNPDLLMIDGKPIWKDDPDFAAEVEKLGKETNERWGWPCYHGDVLEMAYDGLEQVGCAKCPWFYQCAEMLDHEVDEEGNELQ